MARRKVRKVVSVDVVEAVDAPKPPQKTRWIRLKVGARLGCRYCGLTIGKVVKALHDFEEPSYEGPDAHVKFQMPPKKHGHCPKCSTNFQDRKLLWIDGGWR